MLLTLWGISLCFAPLALVSLANLSDLDDLTASVVLRTLFFFLVILLLLVFFECHD